MLFRSGADDEGEQFHDVGQLGGDAVPANPDPTRISADYRGLAEHGGRTGYACNGPQKRFICPSR